MVKSAELSVPSVLHCTVAHSSVH